MRSYTQQCHPDDSAKKTNDKRLLQRNQTPDNAKGHKDDDDYIDNNPNNDKYDVNED